MTNQNQIQEEINNIVQLLNTEDETESATIKSTPASECHTRTRKSEYVQPETTPAIQYESMLSNGKWYDEPNIEKFLERAIKMDARYAKCQNRPAMTLASEVLVKLATGAELRYDMDWYENIRMTPTPPALEVYETKLCDCGHEVNKSLAMSASLGSSCPDCYDRMSD